jgi:hypothetical protein
MMMDLLILWGITLLLLSSLGQTWLLHRRLPAKKKPGRKKSKVKPPPVGQPVKRHRAVTAEEIQPRE